MIKMKEYEVAVYFDGYDKPFVACPFARNEDEAIRIVVEHLNQILFRVHLYLWCRNESNKKYRSNLAIKSIEVREIKHNE